MEYPFVHVDVRLAANEIFACDRPFQYWAPTSINTARNPYRAIAQSTLLYAAELTWNGRKGMEGWEGVRVEAPAGPAIGMLSNEERATPGCWPS